MRSTQPASDSVLNRLVAPVRTWIGASFLTLASSCALGTPAIDGVVVNHMDRKPIADAFVIVTWRYVGSDGYGSRSSCRGIEILRSDDQGRYALDAQQLDALVNIVVYKQGYERYNDGRTTRTNEEYERGLRLREMVRFQGAVEKRLEYLKEIGGFLDCQSADIISTVRPLYKALDEEVTSLGGPPVFMKTLGYLERDTKAEENRKRRNSQ